MISYLHHLFIPHEGNNHRSFLLHHKSLFLLILLITICSSLVFIVRHTAPGVLGIATNINASDLLTITNQKRQEEGVPPLVLNGELAGAAAQKASYMFEKDFWAHNGPDGTTPWVFFQKAGYSYIYAGENLAKDFSDSTGVVNAWMASPSHRENMLNSRYNEVGFAVVNGKLNGADTTLVVEMFGRRQSLASAPEIPAAKTETALPVNAQAFVISPPPVEPTIVPTVIKTPPKLVSRPALIAGVTNQPLLDSQSITKRIAVAVLVTIIIAFILDMVYIERKKLVRMVGHNADHILFLVGAIILILLFGRGVVL